MMDLSLMMTDIFTDDDFACLAFQTFLLAPFLNPVRTDGIASFGILRKPLWESGMKSFRFQAFTLKRFVPFSF